MTIKIWSGMAIAWFALAILCFIKFSNLELFCILIAISSIFSVGIGILSKLEKLLEEK